MRRTKAIRCPSCASSSLDIFLGKDAAAMTEPLYHISDQPDIVCFEPRPHEKHSGKMVWAIDAAHLHNYLLPRQCPRVTFYADTNSTPEDVARLMCGSTAKHVVAIESGWLPEVLASRIYLYTFPPESFTLQDANAGYYTSRETVIPSKVTPINNLLEALLQFDVELRVMPSLWKLREEVIHSTIQFSIIRFGNAVPPKEGADAYTTIVGVHKIGLVPPRP